MAMTVDQLTPKQEKAIAALLVHPTVQQAAQDCGIPSRTLYRWLEEGPFKEAYRRGRREAFGQAVGLCQRLAPAALSTLAKIMADPKAPVSARVSAACAVLKFGREALELDDLAARVEALEGARQDVAA